MRGTWVRRPAPHCPLSIVFLHGVLSDGRCWTNANGTYWPDLLSKEAEFKDAGIYVFEYQTGFFSGTYRLGDVVDALRAELRLSQVTSSRQLVFVAHSMGGIVARRYVVQNALELVQEGKEIGLFLIASPSLGSSYANWLAPLAQVLSHTQADALRFSQGNSWLLDLDRDFLNLKEAGRLKLRGKELIEDKFVILGRWLRRQVVEPFSGARYFGDALKIPGSDHFSIAKVADEQALQHRLLVEFLRPYTQAEAVHSLAPPAFQTNLNVGEMPAPPFMRQSAFYQRISDGEILLQLNRMRRCRFLAGFDAREEARRFLERLRQSELAGGSPEVRARALAWCARILSNGETTELARRALSDSIELLETDESKIAGAVLLANSDYQAALAQLWALNTPESLTAAMRLVFTNHGADATISWATNAGLAESRFDADGKYTFFQAALLSQDWDILFRIIDIVEEDELLEAPVLLFLVAMAHLLKAVPIAERAQVAQQIPIDAASFPLSSQTEDLQHRRSAGALFARLAEYCRAVDLKPTSNVASDYALWLRLRDPETCSVGLEELRASLRDPIQLLRRLNLALAYEIEVDVGAIEARLDQSIAFSGTGTPDEAFARFALISLQPSPKEGAAYIAKHRTQLYAHLQRVPLLGFEVEVLARSGQIAAAQAKLAEASREGMSAGQLAALNVIIAEALGNDPLAERRKLYETTGELPALRFLAAALNAKGLWEELLPYAQKLFAETGDVVDCLLVARTLDELDRYRELFQFLSEHSSFVHSSIELKAIWAWTLWREGKFAEASSVLRDLQIYRNSESYRALRINLAISSGDWNALNLYCEDIWSERDIFGPDVLLRAAELGQVVGNVHTQDLVVAAVHKAPDDPAVLANAYFQSAQGGWEQTAQNGRWIETAAAKSGADGPVKMVSLKELVEQRPAWDRQLSDVVQELRAGRLPSFVAANILKRPMADFTLNPALANSARPDLRKRSVIHAYSGARAPVTFPIGASIAVELGALFTLAHLNLLEDVCQRFKVVVPQTTLSWLFRERANSVFHQRSRVKDAQQLKHLVSTRVLSILECPPNPDHELTTEVGKPLADLLVLAKSQSEGGTPTVVVRSAPIHRIGSLMFEQANMGTYSRYIVSCAKFLDVLKARGVLTAREEAHARAYLRTQEQLRPSEPLVDANTQYYLDGLSITYLRSAGLLSKLKGAGVRVFIARDDDDDANSLLEMTDLDDEQSTVIEGIRAMLEAGLTAGTVKAVRAAIEGRDHEFQTHPTYSILALAEPVDVLLIDDRAINRNLQVEHEGRMTRIVTTLDLLDALKSNGVISESDALIHRTRLRQFGYQIIPVTEVELRAHIYSATISKGELIETAELRAIRESLLQARMTRIVQLPFELPALQTMRVTFIGLAREVWQGSASAEDAAARANWLLRVSDIRPWASVIEKTRVRDFVHFSQAETVLQLAFAPVDLDQARTESYLEWVTEHVLTSVQQGQPRVYELVLAQIKEFIVECVERGLKEEL